MEESRIETRQGKPLGRLIVVLLGLLVVIVGLVVAIVVARNVMDNDEEISEENNIECSDYDTVEDVQLCIEGKGNEDTTVDEWANYYQEAIDSSLEEGDSVLAAGLLNAKNDYLVGWGRCDEAIKELDELDKSLYTLGMLVELYYNGVHYANTCGNAEASQRFTTVYEGLINGEQNV